MWRENGKGVRWRPKNLGHEITLNVGSMVVVVSRGCICILAIAGRAEEFRFSIIGGAIVQRLIAIVPWSSVRGIRGIRARNYLPVGTCTSVCMSRELERWKDHVFHYPEEFARMSPSLAVWFPRRVGVRCRELIRGTTGEKSCSISGVF